MTMYTVMNPPPSGNPVRDAERIVFIKEGFCWPALFAAVPWLVWHRMWLVLAGYLATVAGLVVLSAIVPAPAGGLSALVFAGFFALEANNLRRWTLERNGWTLTGVTTGDRRDELELRHFTAHGAGSAPAAARGGRTNPPTHGTAPVDDAVLGLFPAPESTR